MIRLYSACFGILIVLGGVSVAGAASVTYSYDGPIFDIVAGNDSGGFPLFTSQSITGSFTTEELLPSTLTDLSG
jgi:hypothetical protein